jgi:hypothetical protein
VTGSPTTRRIQAVGMQLLLAAFVAATVVVAAPSNDAQAAPRDTAERTAAQTVEAKVDAPYTPRAGTVFNNPKGSTAKKRAIITEIERSIDGSAPGSTIRMAMYLFDLQSTANALIRAHDRGVHVQVLLDDGETSKPYKDVRHALGNDKTKPSYIFRCKRGCMSSVRSVQHAKFYLFTQVGNAQRVSMVSSANPYTGNTSKSWNDIHTIIGDQKIWDSLNLYFTDMLKDKTNYNYYRTTTSGKYTLYYFPRTPAKGTSGVPQLSALKQVKCKGVASGYGLNGRTAVRVAMWGWTKWRTDVARQLWKLHNEGCNVYVILNNKRVGEKVYRALLKRSSKYGVMRVYDAWYDKNHNGAAELYMHQKLLTINGNFNGDSSVKVLWTGSQNFTDEGNRVNNELLMKIADDSTLNQYVRNLNYIRDRHTKGRIKRVPGYFRAARVQGGDADQQLNGAEPFDFDLPANGDVDFDR